MIRIICAIGLAIVLVVAFVTLAALLVGLLAVAWCLFFYSTQSVGWATLGTFCIVCTVFCLSPDCQGVVIKRLEAKKIA